jgi:hypothetical protein
MAPGPAPDPMVRPFPSPGPLVRNAYRELGQAGSADPVVRASVGPADHLPRPWVPASCTYPPLRVELWGWLDRVVVWVNHDLGFDPVDVVPACWPQHPHLVHELAVLTDQRWRAGRALTGDPLEGWQRIVLPAFFDRLHRSVGEHCHDAHPGTRPTAGRLARHLDAAAAGARHRVFAADLATLGRRRDDPPGPKLRLVNEQTGELVD